MSSINLILATNLTKIKTKNAAYRRHWISQPMRIVSPLSWHFFRYIFCFPRGINIVFRKRGIKKWRSIFLVLLAGFKLRIASPLSWNFFRHIFCFPRGINNFFRKRGLKNMEIYFFRFCWEGLNFTFLFIF